MSTDQICYQVYLLKDRANPGVVRLQEAVNATLRRHFDEEGIGVFGLFHGLFGLASNEAYLVIYQSTAGTASLDLPESLFADIGLSVVSIHRLQPTVRPLEHAPRTAEGIYVFRWFTVNGNNIDEIVRLSNEAWLTFEGGFETEVQGLFKDRNDKQTDQQTSDPRTMLLITWYLDLSVWQASRQPPAAARDNFQRRHALTLEAKPIATRLLQP